MPPTIFVEAYNLRRHTSESFEDPFTIIGETGTVRVCGVAVNEIQHWEFAQPDPQDDPLVKQASYHTTSVYGFGHPLYYDNVIRVLRGEDEPETDGREGGFSTAAAPGEASALYERVLAQLRKQHAPVACGVFGAAMQVSLCNDGPVTFLLQN